MTTSPSTHGAKLHPKVSDAFQTTTILRLTTRSRLPFVAERALSSGRTTSSPVTPTDLSITPTLNALPDSPDGEVALLRFKNDRAEAKGIAELVEGLIDEEGLKPNDILVLMRTDNNGTFSKPIRDELKKRDIESSDPDFVLRGLAEDGNRKLL